MSRYNLNFQIDKYTDDFGNEYDNVPVKIQGNAPQIATCYTPKSGVSCGGSLLFKKRHLLATFPDGRKLQYPSADYADAVACGNILKAEAICIDLVGEYWSFVPGALLGNLQFKDTPYSGLPKRKVYKSWNYNYTSSVNFIGTVKLVARIPTDNTDLEACAKANLAGAQEGGGICAAGGLVEPRHWIIQALADDGNPKLGKVSRKAFVSANAGAAIKSSASGVADCAACLGYQGESVKNFHLLLAD